jgi:hypothetical protein
MSIPPTVRREVQELLQRSLFAAIACFFLSAAALLMAGSTIVFGAVAIFLVGVLGAVLLILSWCHYQPFWSWLIWAVPALVVLVAAFQLILAPLVYAGEVSVLSAVWALGGCWGLVSLARCFCSAGTFSVGLVSDGT